VFGCEEFRAKRYTDDVIWLWPQSDQPSKGQLSVDLYGSNLSEPLVLGLRLNFVDRETDWDDGAVTALLDPELAALLATIPSNAP
jgi:hypothetical protein